MVISLEERRRGRHGVQPLSDYDGKVVETASCAPLLVTH